MHSCAESHLYGLVKDCLYSFASEGRTLHVACGSDVLLRLQSLCVRDRRETFLCQLLHGLLVFSQVQLGPDQHHGNTGAVMADLRKPLFSCAWVLCKKEWNKTIMDLAFVFVLSRVSGACFWWESSKQRQQAYYEFTGSKVKHFCDLDIVAVKTLIANSFVFCPNWYVCLQNKLDDNYTITQILVRVSSLA